MHNKPMTKHKNTDNGSNNKHWHNNNSTTSLERTAAEVTGGLHALNWRQVFDLDSAVVKKNKHR